MGIISTKKTALFINAGTTLPTTPAGFIEANDPVLVTPEFSSIDINRLDGKLNSKDSVLDLCKTKTSFEAKMNMRSSNVAGTALDTPPEYGLLLKAGGFTETIDSTTAGSETVVYTNKNDEIPACSAVAFIDGHKLEMTNSLIADVSIDCVIGTPATITSSFSGFIDDAKGTVETNPTVTLTDEPILIVSCADLISFDGGVIPLKEAKIGMNLESSELYTTGGTNGLKKNIVSDYAATLELTFFVDGATYSREAALIEAGQAKEVIIKLGLDSTSGLVNGKSVEITCSLAKATTYSDSDEENLLSRSLTLRLLDGVKPAISIKQGFFA